MDRPASRGDRVRTAPISWGFVGTGSIARRMADVVRHSPATVLAAVASRNLVTARTFAKECGAKHAFDSLDDMLARDDVDALYIATPTAARERIAVAAARAGKHVLGEKPFASLASLRRITSACRQHGVCFMDATHFVHHPRHAEIKGNLAETIGAPLSLETRFLIDLTNRENIRFDPEYRSNKGPFRKPVPGRWWRRHADACGARSLGGTGGLRGAGQDLRTGST